MSAASQIWATACARLDEALVARDVMRDAAAPGWQSDAAVTAYTNAVDELVKEMEALRGQLVLREIADFLARRSRGGRA